MPKKWKLPVFIVGAMLGIGGLAASLAILAPAGTPKEIIARLNAEALKAVGDPDVRRRLEELGFAVRGSSPEELRILTRDQLAKYARVIKDMGIANE